MPQVNRTADIGPVDFDAANDRKFPRRGTILGDADVIDAPLPTGRGIRESLFRLLYAKFSLESETG